MSALQSSLCLFMIFVLLGDSAAGISWSKATAASLTSELTESDGGASEDSARSDSVSDTITVFSEADTTSMAEYDAQGVGGLRLGEEMIKMRGEEGAIESNRQGKNRDEARLDEQGQTKYKETKHKITGTEEGYT